MIESIVAAVFFGITFATVAALVWHVLQRTTREERRSPLWAHAELPPRPDWSAPCPACGCIIDRDDANLLLTGLYVSADSPLGSAINLGRPNPSRLPLRRFGPSIGSEDPTPEDPSAA